MRIISSVLRHSKKKLQTPIVKMLTRSVTKSKGKWIVEREKRNQDNKRRRLQLLVSEKKLLDKFPEGCLHGPSRHDLNRILSALEFGPTTKEGCTIDASGFINAVQGAGEGPHDEDAEMERWRMMYEGMGLETAELGVGSKSHKAWDGIL